MKKNFTIKTLCLLNAFSLFFVFASDLPAANTPAKSYAEDNFYDPFSEEQNALKQERQEKSTQIADPLKPLNRGIYYFNDKFYLYALKPASSIYKAILPKGIRKCFSNFFSHLDSTLRFANCVLQGKFHKANTELKRFTINTTLGLLGFCDPALAHFNLEKQDEDLGQTLGFYGIGDGFFLMLPFIGPSSLRDGIGRLGDIYLQPYVYTIRTEEQLALRSFYILNDFSLYPERYEELKRDTFDPYIAFRNAYSQYRKNKIKQ